MRNKNLPILIFFLIISLTAKSQTLQDMKFGKGMINFTAKDSSFSVKFAPRFQYLSSTEWTDDGNGYGDANTSAFIRRARLKFDGFALSPKLKYKLELGLSNRDIAGASIYTKNTPRYILDALIKWNFYENFVLWAGQTKLPGNRERVISSGDLQLVDRSLLNATFNIDRDVGLQLRHHFTIGDRFLVREIFSWAQGEGRNVVTGNLGGHQYTGRIEFLPFGKFKGKGDYKGSGLTREEKLKVAIGASYDFNNNAVKTRSNQGSYMTNDIGYYETNISTVFIDAILNYKGFSFMGEYSSRDAEDPIAKNADGSATGDFVSEGNGLNIQSGYLLKKNWELTGRYTFIDLKLSEISEQYTLGVSKYILGHKLKVQSDVSYLTLNNIGSEIRFRLQVDIHF